MKRRICLVGTALVAVPFAVGIGVTAAAAKSKAHHGKPAPSKSVAVLKCHVSLGTVPPPGSSSVDQPPAQGTAYGKVHCPTASFGSGVEAASFKVIFQGGRARRARSSAPGATRCI